MPQERTEAARVDPALTSVRRQQGSQFRCEQQPPIAHRVIQRLDPETVPHEQESLLARIPQRDGEHAAQLLEHPFALLVEECEEDFGVGL